MVDTKKEQERDELHRLFGQLLTNCGVQLTDGILRIMFLERCSIDIFLKICVIT